MIPSVVASESGWWLNRLCVIPGEGCMIGVVGCVVPGVATLGVVVLW